MTRLDRDLKEAEMIDAHKAGTTYWTRNKPYDATRENLASHARSCGWHGDATSSWLAGFYGAKRRDVEAMEYNRAINYGYV